MLDTRIENNFSIEANLPNKPERNSEILLLRACKIHIFSDGRIYSEFEDQTFDILNHSNGYGALDIEFVLENNIVKEKYPQFYTKCFVIRTDKDNFIKPIKTSNAPACSKINQNGEMVIGIRYFFRDEEEIMQIVNCKKILVEGFIALGKPTNVFGIMCQLKKGEKKWKIEDVYTYKPKYAKNIKNLID